jgi:hypothetical protein
VEQDLPEIPPTLKWVREVQRVGTPNDMSLRLHDIFSPSFSQTIG